MAPSLCAGGEADAVAGGRLARSFAAQLMAAMATVAATIRATEPFRDTLEALIAHLPDMVVVQVTTPINRSTGMPPLFALTYGFRSRKRPIWHRRLSCRLALLTIMATGPPVARADEGAAAFNNYCRTCHSVHEGDNRLGPSLHRIIGAQAGTVPGYATYSQGLRDSGITWDEATLDAFLMNPDALISNNNMKPFKGINDGTVRAKIIKFLRARDRPVLPPE
jgi:cytochrome c